MASQKQIHANRRNAQSSTGPRTAEGKTRSSQNALQTGIYAAGTVIGYESIEQLNKIEAQFTADYQPVTATERSLVDQLIHCEWMLRRFRWVETEVWKAAAKSRPTAELEISPSGFSFIREPSINRLYRQRTAVQRAFRETLAELRRVRADDPPQDPGPVPASPPMPVQPVEPTPASLPIGFVPSNRRTPSLVPSPHPPVVVDNGYLGMKECVTVQRGHVVCPPPLLAHLGHCVDA